MASTCASELVVVDSSLRVLGGSVEGAPWRPGRGYPGRALIIVKSVSEPSIDEIPIVESILGALAASGVYRVEVYEYEPLLARPGRSRRAAALIEKAISEGGALVALAPEMLAISLASRLPEGVAGRLEEGVLARVRVRYENLLYLPPGSTVTLAAKANSSSSHERVEWLRAQAQRLGVEVEDTVYLEDNAAILDLMRSRGPMGHTRVVPVTKLARAVVALARCLGLGGIVELRRVEESSHTVYAVNLDPDTAEAIIHSLRARLARPHKPLPPRSPVLRGLYERGVEDTVAAVGEAIAPGRAGEGSTAPATP
ncbi:MAG: hypothetical protein GSR80_000412 [Desulfurococcales archaeon]|nr:hypothetical protein [Desulfurococcales archaeon]